MIAKKIFYTIIAFVTLLTRFKQVNKHTIFSSKIIYRNCLYFYGILCTAMYNLSGILRVNNSLREIQ